MTVIASGFNANKPISCAQGRYGELIIAQGGGLQPKRWPGSGTATNAGIVAPAAAPTIALDTTKRYYVARVDVYKPGAVYNAPPSVTFTTRTTQPAGHRTATAKAYLSQSSLSEILVTDGGKNYSEPPSVALSGGAGGGAVITPIMSRPAMAANSITMYEVIQGPPFSDEDGLPIWHRTQYPAWGQIEISLTNGSHTITRTVYAYHGQASDDPNDCDNYISFTLSLIYTVSGATGTGATAYVNFYGHGVDAANCEDDGTTVTCDVTYHTSCFIGSVDPVTYGSGYHATNAVTIEIAASFSLNTATCSLTATPPSSKKIIIKGYPPGHASNTSASGASIAGFTITDGGSGYVVAPEIKISSRSGFGASAYCTVQNGEITGISLDASGGGFTEIPTVTAVSGNAQAFAVARPHLRGKYQCYYRYIDNTTEASGGPIPSNLSPVREVDASDGAAKMTWTATAPSNTDGRSLTVELWRTTGDQALMLYRVGTGTSFVDDLTDEEVRNPDRAGYAAMPIVLPNGDLNAMRFTPPPNNKAVVVRYQDRFWYGVDTSGTQPNTLYFSEVDEPESVPDINEFVLQQNARDGDYVTALIPFGTSMLVMQSRHAYTLSFAKEPLRDADVSLVAYRGCAGQRCWDIHEGVCYVMDQSGVYAITRQGDVDDISNPINNIIRTQVDWANAAWNFVLVDAHRKVVRAFVAFKGDASTGYPTRALCYSILTKTWWMERYPHRISSGTSLPLSNGDYRGVYGASGGVYMIDEGHADAARGAVSTVTITNKGAGYRRPPTVTAAGGSGAEFQAAIDAEGQVSGIWIIHPGYGYSAGSLTISAPDDPDCAAPVQAVATFTATSTSSDTAISPVYRYRTGNRPFPTDMTNPRGGGSVQPRDISVTYQPQPSSCDLAVRLYYNNSQYARPYVANRNRGVGFRTSTVDGAARMDMSALSTRTGYDSGVAKVSLASRTTDDIQSSDRHVAVEFIGARRTADPVVIYELDVYGTAADAKD